MRLISISAILPSSSQWIQVPLNTWFNVKITLERANLRFRFDFVDGGISHTFYVGVTSTTVNTFNDSGATDLFYL